MTDPESSHDAERDAARVDDRARLQPEERRAGSDDPHRQAEAILAESEERTEDPGAAPDATVEHRSSGRATHGD